MNNFDFKIFTDGGSRGNPGEAAYGFVVYDKEGQLLVEHGERIGINTNNVAEYSGILSALKWVLDKGGIEKPNVDVYMDSQLAAMQLTGKWKVKNEGIRALVYSVKDIERKLDGNVSYTAVRREFNKEADRMVNVALDAKI